MATRFAKCYNFPYFRLKIVYCKLLLVLFKNFLMGSASKQAKTIKQVLHDLSTVIPKVFADLMKVATYCKDGRCRIDLWPHC